MMADPADLTGKLEKLRALGGHQRKSWLWQHIQDFVTGLVRHGYDVDIEATEFGTIFVVRDATSQAGKPSSADASLHTQEGPQ